MTGRSMFDPGRVYGTPISRFWQSSLVRELHHAATEADEITVRLDSGLVGVKPALGIVTHDRPICSCGVDLLLRTMDPTDTENWVEIRTSISPSSAVELNTTSAFANYATEAALRLSGMVIIRPKRTLCAKHNVGGILPPPPPNDLHPSIPLYNPTSPQLSPLMTQDDNPFQPIKSLAYWAGAEDTEKQSTVKKSSHLTESSKTTTTTTTTTSSQQTFRPVNLVNIPLPTTGGHWAQLQEEPKEATWQEYSGLYRAHLKLVSLSECDHEEKPVCYTIVPSAHACQVTPQTPESPITFLSCYFIQSYKERHKYFTSD
uniref:Uncharacterized protein n=1 Tax=Timema genevievae TaxID=629358 RepID=A0A7R9PGZ5_TIMGE|nr:unnamed protein product [Timema genevievae]